MVIKMARRNDDVNTYDSGVLEIIAGTGIVHTTDTINGEILKIVYIDTDLEAGADIVVTTDISPSETIDTVTNIAGDTIVYPATALSVGAAGDNKWTKFIINSPLVITVTQAVIGQTCRVYIYYR